MHVEERMNRTITEMPRTMLIDVVSSKFWWFNAVFTFKQLGIDPLPSHLKTNKLQPNKIFKGVVT